MVTHLSGGGPDLQVTLFSPGKPTEQFLASYCLQFPVQAGQEVSQCAGHFHTRREGHVSDGNYIREEETEDDGGSIQRDNVPV